MQVFDKVKLILVQQFHKDEAEIKSETSFMDDLGIESLDFVELMIALEEEFDIVISDEDVEKIRTVDEAVQYIQKLI
nr:acyl carrier protein [Desulfoscipio gibsoniae]